MPDERGETIPSRSGWRRLRGLSVMHLGACTPIEQAFSKLTSIPRGLGAQARDVLADAICLAADAITRTDVGGWFAHAGLALPD